MTHPELIRPASKADQTALAELISTERYLHRHLDWCTALDWLGSKPFWVVEEKNRITAAMACPADPPEIAWVRLFVGKHPSQLPDQWKILLEKCIEELHPPVQILACLVLRSWMTNLLEKSGFKHHQDIVVLSREVMEPLPQENIPSEIFIRPMEQDDLPQVAEVDQLAFEPIWRNSLEGIRYSYHATGYMSVAEIDGKIVGYQVSTSNPFSAHLARLAVLPEFSRRKIGYSLLYDLIQQMQKQKLWMLTVNTQDNNKASLALYQKMGFFLSEEHYPVYTLPIENV